VTRNQVLRPLARHRGQAVVVTTMGTVRPWARVSSHPLDFASADSAMGHAADFALGVALAQPQRKVVCLNGDGSMLMSLGSLVTIVASGARNLVLFVFQNDTYELTGNQAIPGAGHVDFPAMARAAGFTRVHLFDDPAAYEAALPSILGGTGPVCVTVRVEPGTEGPLGRGGSEVATYLRPSLAESVRILKQALIGGEWPSPFRPSPK
jgi:thiamine pyrophosphate-dependent acetolactate synthase large subunit-like protein